MKCLLLSFLCFLVLPLAAQSTDHKCAVEILRKSISAMGGEKKLSELNNVMLSGNGHINYFEQSERFEGPYIPGYFKFVKIIDFKNALASIKRDVGENQMQQFLVDQDVIAIRSRKGMVLPVPQNHNLQDELSQNPVIVLTYALKASSLVCLKDTLFQGVFNNRIQFDHLGYPVVLWINTDTNLPNLIELEKPYNDSYFNVWGDLKKQIYFSYWDLLGNGVHYPMQTDVFFHGKLWESTLISSASINQPIGVDSLRIPADVKAKCKDYGQLEQDNFQKLASTRIEIAKDIWLIPGFCNTTIVKQNDKLVIIETAVSSLNMDRVIEQSKQLFSVHAPISFITTSDAWLHCGGVRSAAFHGRVTALLQNKAIIESLLCAEYKSNPDAWQNAKGKKPEIQFIDNRTIMGEGINRMELIPFRTEAGERMMMVYFPEHRLLYASDLLQPGNWQKHYTLEVIQAVSREKLDVDMVYAMHMKPVKYQQVLDSMKAFLPN